MPYMIAVSLEMSDEPTFKVMLQINNLSKDGIPSLTVEVPATIIIGGM